MCTTSVTCSSYIFIVPQFLFTTDWFIYLLRVLSIIVCLFICLIIFNVCRLVLVNPSALNLCKPLRVTFMNVWDNVLLRWKGFISTICFIMDTWVRVMSLFLIFLSVGQTRLPRIVYALLINITEDS